MLKDISVAEFLSWLRSGVDVLSVETGFWHHSLRLMEIEEFRRLQMAIEGVLLRQIGTDCCFWLPSTQQYNVHSFLSLVNSPPIASDET